jgi:hypothetical protein
MKDSERSSEENTRDMKIGDLVRHNENSWTNFDLAGKVGIIEKWYCVTRGWVYVYWADGIYNRPPVQTINLKVINESR